MTRCLSCGRGEGEVPFVLRLVARGRPEIEHFHICGACVLQCVEGIEAKTGLVLRRFVEPSSAPPSQDEGYGP